MTSINLEDDYIKKTNIADAELNFEKIQDYMNNYSYKTSYVNIDSRNRHTVPVNNVDLQTSFLPNNPITTFTDEYRVRVSVTNNYSIGDKIILQNIKSTKIILNKPIYLINNYNYYMVNMNNHMIKSQYTLTDNYRIFVSLYDTMQQADYLINNIPINSIIGIHSIFIYNNNESFLPDTVRDTILNTHTITVEQLIQNYFFIKLPFNYINTESNTFENINKIFTFESNNIGGINLPYLNANYPINTGRYQAYHEITKCTSSYIEFRSSAIGIYSESKGGSNVIIGKVNNTIEGYPYANNYTITLKKTFSDVSRIELVSTEFPYIDYNLKNNITIKNNRIYWQYYEDGDYIYNINVPEGQYYPDMLAVQLKTQMNAIKRISSSAKEVIYNDFDITFNLNSQEFKFISYKTKLLSYSLSIANEMNLGSEYMQLTIKHPNNNVTVGDTISITNASDIGDISATLINTDHVVHSVNFEAETYSVLLIITQFFDNINLIGNGGAKTTVKSPAFVSFLFNYPDTMGCLLGFKNTGDATSITPFKHINSNMNAYIYPTPFDSVGNSIIPNNYFNFSGQNYYMLMYMNDYENIYNTNNIDNAFSKILMSGHPSDILFNTFICAPHNFDIPIKTLNTIKIRFLFPDGTLPDFRNLNHSFTLKIIERISKPPRTGLNSMKMNYTDGLKELAFSEQNAV